MQECVFSTASAVVTSEELLDQQRRLIADTDFRSHFDQLADFPKVERFEVDAKEVPSLAINNPFGVGSRRAFVVTSQVIYGIVRMFDVYTDQSQSELQLFDDFSAAVVWLNLNTK